MVFSSILFVYFFLPGLLLGHLALDRFAPRWRNLWLAATGYLFYAWAEPRFVPLMFFTTFLDWLLSLAIAKDTWRVWAPAGAPVPPLSIGGARSRRQRAALCFSILSNLCVLGFFKYFNFGLENAQMLLGALGHRVAFADAALRVVLPLGISFYTLQALSYTIDIYRGEAAVMGNFLDFACFVYMVPHLVAGPILKFSFLAPQLTGRIVTSSRFARGVAIFSLGLAKKVCLANPCGRIADIAFAAENLHALDAWAGALAFSFQIYFDFSGYSDMATGLGLMLGFVFPKNFDSPYRAESITEFWRRWHISLSTWLREYLYIPLGGNRLGSARAMANLWLTMLIGGLWHGASWTYVLWGAWHGTLLASEKLRGRLPLYAAAPRAIRVIFTFALVMIGWVIFRSASLGRALHYLSSMAGWQSPAPEAALIAPLWRTPYYLLALALAALAAWKGVQVWDWTQELTLPRACACLACGGAGLLLLSTQGYNPFIYFIF